MEQKNYPKVYLYRRIVQAKLFIDSHFSERIDLDNISGEAYFSKFHFLRLFKKTYGIYEELKAKGVVFKKSPTQEFYGIEALFTDDSGNWFSLGQKQE